MNLNIFGLWELHSHHHALLSNIWQAGFHPAVNLPPKADVTQGVNPAGDRDLLSLNLP